MFLKDIRSIKISPISKIFIAIFISSLVGISLVYFLLKVHIVRDKITNNEIKTITVPKEVYESMLFVTDLSKIKERISLVNQKYEVKSLKWQIPGTLIIEVSPLVPVAFIRDGDRFMSISENGKILEWTDSEPEDLGEIILKNSIGLRLNREFGKLDDLEMGISLGVATVFQTNSISAFRIIIHDEVHIEAVLPASETTIRISSKIDKKSTLSRLDGFLKRLYTSGRSIKVLDLRFEKPIIEVNQ